MALAMYTLTLVPVLRTQELEPAEFFPTMAILRLHKAFLPELPAILWDNKVSNSLSLL